MRLSSVLRHVGCATVAVLSCNPVFAQDGPPAPPAWESSSWNNPPAQAIPGIEHRSFRSPTIDAEVGYSVLLPPGYESSTRRYPVLYSLHGAGGDENTAPGQVGPLITAALTSGTLPPFIVVFVNGGRWSYYADSSDGRVRSETLFVSELIPHIDATLRTIPARSGRALEGMSMGGFGALSLAARHTELFGSVVAYAASLLEVKRDQSGALTLDMAAGIPDGLSGPPAGMLESWRGTFTHMFGGQANAFAAYDPLALFPEHADTLQGQLPLRLVVGTIDGLRNANQLLHEQLLARGYSHDLVLVPDVAHQYQLLYEAEGLAGLQFHARVNGWR